MIQIALIMEVISYVFIFISGLFVGSFLNVVADRIVKEKSFIKGRSECESCKRTLKTFDLVPLLSYVFLKGKCKYCKDKISLYYPLSELLTGLSFVGLAYYVGIFVTPINYYALVIYIYFLIVACIFIILFLTDAKYRLLPNKITKFGIIFVLVFLVFNFAYTAGYSYYQLKNDDFGKYLLQSGYWHQQVFYILRSMGYTAISTIAIGLFFWFLTKIKKGRAMGGGDVKLAILIGLFNGFPFNLLGIFLGFLTGAVYSIALMILRKKKLKDTVAFGPFLILGSVIAFLYGSYILSWYLGLFS